MRAFARICTFACAVVLVCTVAPADDLKPFKVGEEEILAIETAHPYGPGDQEWVVSYPGATYIRLHFSLFDLAPGDSVTISSPDGLESFTYTGSGPHGNGHFWANTIVGDIAIVTLQSTLGGDPGLYIDLMGRGTVPWFPEPEEPQPESVCGLNDWLDVECYRNSYPTEFERARGAVKLLIGSTSACTGWKVSDSGQFMTNNHCTSSQSGVQSTELRFEYQNNSCGGGGSGYSHSTFGSQLVSTDYTLDYTLFTALDPSPGYPCLQIDDRLAPEGERMYIAHHPSGGVKKLSIESTYSANPTGLCDVDNSPHYGRATDTDIGYYCDTTNGSSGSPVLSGETHKVIAIHHFGGCLNSGVRMDWILDNIGNKIDTCAGGGECGDGTCDAGEDECSCPGDCGVPEPDEFGMCTDGVDNDCDNNTDCDDTDCDTDPACAEPYCGDNTCDAGEDQCNCAADCGTPPADETGLCDDGIDNDCDGATDGADADCSSTCGERKAPCTQDSDCCSNTCFFHPKQGGICK